MIGWLRGRTRSEEPDGGVVLDVNGVGYELRTPVGAIGRARADGGEVEFFVHTHVREDALDLYGFPNETERRVFRLLLGIPNVGPKTALGVLSALSVGELARAIASSDIGRLHKVPGIGKKTAERLVLELKDKLGEVEIDGAVPATSTPAPNARGRLLSALTNMGYRPGEAEKAVASLGQRVDSAPLAELLKAALAELR
ncbi:MAG TPA: Holliday junction branch migration protein RuvA [Polyangiaceae bacterium]